MADGAVLYESQHGVATIKMDDGKVNALNGPMLEGLMAAFDRAAEEEANVVVLRGRSGRFSAGLDLKVLPTLEKAELHRVLLIFRKLAARIASFPRPVLAAVTGHAIAGGSVILLACDHNIGLEGDYKLGLNEVAIGIALPSFVVELARAALPIHTQNQSLLHGRIYDVPGALQAGLLHETCSPDEFDATVQKRAATLAMLPEPAYSLSKSRLRGHLAEVDEEGFLTQIDKYFAPFLAN